MERQAILLNKIRELECAIVELDLEIESMVYLHQSIKRDVNLYSLLKKHYYEFGETISEKEKKVKHEILRLRIMKRETEIKLEKLKTLRNGVSKGIYEEAPESIIIL